MAVSQDASVAKLLAKRGVTKRAVFCPAFVADCLEDCLFWLDAISCYVIQSATVRSKY